METPQRLVTPSAGIASPPHGSELRDWSYLPDLLLSEVLRRVVSCLCTLSAFAATCRPWRRRLLASVSTLLLRRILPLLCEPRPSSYSHSLRAWSPTVIPLPITAPLAAAVAGPFHTSTLLSSRGHLIFLVRYSGLLVVVDALTGAERQAFPLPSPHSSNHYATLTATHLLFVSKHEFVSIPFPPAGPRVEEWTHHRLPRAASSIAPWSSSAAASSASPTSRSCWSSAASTLRTRRQSRCYRPPASPTPPRSRAGTWGPASWSPGSGCFCCCS